MITKLLAVLISEYVRANGPIALARLEREILLRHRVTSDQFAAAVCIAVASGKVRERLGGEALERVP